VTAGQATRAVTGIKPTGAPHLGNWVGMIVPALELARSHQAVYFIADGHALTAVRDPAELARRTREAAATWLALGLDPERELLYRQSDVPEVFELAWVLACSTPKGLLNRAHAYKAAVDANLAAGRAADDGVNAGLYGYPVLMAADILLFEAGAVPVGQDQRQHVEVARDVAAAFNAAYGPVLTLPEPVIRPDVATLPGLDGRKMSKSYGNTIPVFAPPAELRRLVMRIVTDSRGRAEPKDPGACTVFALYRLLADPAEVAAMRAAYLDGAVGYAEAKRALADVLDRTLGPARAAYQGLLADPARIETVLGAGAARARALAAPLLDRVRAAVGLGPRFLRGGAARPP